MKVLITGAAGFLGARLCEVLLEGGHAVCALDLFGGELGSIRAARLERVKRDRRFLFVQGDVRDRQTLEEALERCRPEAVVHLATWRNLELAEREPAACLRLHAEGTVAVLAACRRFNVGQLVLGSSAHVYGGSRSYPFVEQDPCDRPLSVLGASFRAAELCAHALALRSPVSTTVLRLFSMYGPGQAPEHLVPRLMAAAERRAALPLVGDGTAARDFLFVDDAVVGVLRALERPAPWRILNLGSGETTTLAQVAEQVAALADVALNVGHLPARSGELPATYADTRAAQEVLGFVPVVRLEDGLRRTWAWWRQRPEAFREPR
jgi:UDP-glucuronate 4-epimerase